VKPRCLDATRRVVTFLSLSLSLFLLRGVIDRAFEGLISNRQTSAAALSRLSTDLTSVESETRDGETRELIPDSQRGHGEIIARRECRVDAESLVGSRPEIGH
jgi:hypothetical protein